MKTTSEGGERGFVEKGCCGVFWELVGVVVATCDGCCACVTPPCLWGNLMSGVCGLERNLATLVACDKTCCCIFCFVKKKKKKSCGVVTCSSSLWLCCLLVGCLFVGCLFVCCFVVFYVCSFPSQKKKKGKLPLRTS